MRFHVGNFHIPLDDIIGAVNDYRYVRREKKSPSTPHLNGYEPADEWQEIREMAVWALRGVQEVQLHAGHFDVTRKVPYIQPQGHSTRALKIGVKEPSLDFSRLDPASPTHRMHFQPGTMAHRVFVTAISIDAQVDEGDRKETILNIPMVTLTTRTTIFSRSVELSESEDADKN